MFDFKQNNKKNNFKFHNKKENKYLVSSFS